MKGCIIGSFRKFYDEMIPAIKKFNKENITILSPRVSSIINPEDSFVLLESDDKKLSNEQIQAQVIEHTHHSDFVYVWDPEGYIGNTTCYEIGRLVERGIKLYFMEQPKDLPIKVESKNIVRPEELIEILHDLNNY